MNSDRYHVGFHLSKDFCSLLYYNIPSLTTTQLASLILRVIQFSHISDRTNEECILSGGSCDCLNTPATVLLSTLFTGLADPAHLSYLLIVRKQSRTVNEVVATTGLSQPNMSKHLACLRECGLVASERSGRHVSYHVAHPGVECLLQAAETLLTDIGETVVACPTYGQRNKQ